MYGRFSSAHAYARRNGYKGSYEEYLTLQYKAYRAICERCASKPMSRDQWLASEAM